MFFSNITWTKAVNDPEAFADQRAEADAIVESFGQTNIFVSLIIFLVLQVSVLHLLVVLPHCSSVSSRSRRRGLGLIATWLHSGYTNKYNSDCILKGREGGGGGMCPL